MIYTIEISVQAEADLRGIYEYIAFELLSPKNASSHGLKLCCVGTVIVTLLVPLAAVKLLNNVVPL